MRVRSTARAVLIGTTVVVALAGGPASTLAAKPPAAAPWIALGSVDGTYAATSQPRLGSAVSFATGYPTNTKNPWVSVMCYQSGTLVYGEGGGPTHTFALGGASSLWLEVGGTASCNAELGDLYWKGGREYYTPLATTSFEAAAS